MTQTTSTQPGPAEAALLVLDPADLPWADEEWFSAGDPARVELESMLEQLAGLEDTGETGKDPDATRVAQLGLLERIKAAAAGAQARITRGFETSQLAQQKQAGVSARHRGRGIGDQVALARGCPARQGGRHLGFAKALTEMPHTDALLRGGELSEWTATLLVRETACLTVEDRGLVDQRLAATTLDPATGEITPPRVTAMTPRRVEAAARALATELDAAAVVRRAAKATKDRKVTSRPAPDTMTYLTALLPLAQGVAAFANLHKTARALKATGDHRSINQLMADLLVERLTGQPTAAAVPVEVGLVMTPDTLLGHSDRPAATTDGTVVPAQVARDLVHTTDAPVWLRRIFTDPLTGAVTDIDPARRRFNAADEKYLRWRDRTCRQPSCDSDIQHSDHIKRHADGGPTTRANGQGLCEPHNLVKEAPGWTHEVIDARPGRHTTQITTPTGSVHRSQAPPALPPPARE